FWRNVISLVSAVYCILTLREFMKRRAQFSQFINSTTSLPFNHYSRLMRLATAELSSVFLFPHTVFLPIHGSPSYPWKSWSDIHFDWYIVDSYPTVLWRFSRLITFSLELSRWSLVFCAFVFFGFFGFAEEARKQYRDSN
ncbi:GPCR fungal pheromone mating factor, partial [Pholiota molesta]